MTMLKGYSGGIIGHDDCHGGGGGKVSWSAAGDGFLNEGGCLSEAWRCFTLGNGRGARISDGWRVSRGDSAFF
jgi:hypothetical protein